MQCTYLFSIIFENGHAFRFAAFWGKLKMNLEKRVNFSILVSVKLAISISKDLICESWATVI